MCLPFNHDWQEHTVQTKSGWFNEYRYCTKCSKWQESCWETGRWVTVKPADMDRILLYSLKEIST